MIKKLIFNIISGEIILRKQTTKGVENMGRILFSCLCICIFGGMTMAAENNFETDIIKTAQGDLVITCIGHGTLMMGM